MKIAREGKDRPFFAGYPHKATGFRNGLALSTNESSHNYYNTQILCDYECITIDYFYDKKSAHRFHNECVHKIEKFLTLYIKDMPRFINDEDSLIKTLATWTLAGSI